MACTSYSLIASANSAATGLFLLLLQDGRVTGFHLGKKPLVALLDQKSALEFGNQSSTNQGILAATRTADDRQKACGVKW